MNFKMAMPGMCEKINAQLQADGVRVDDPTLWQMDIELSEDGKTLILNCHYGEWSAQFNFPDWFLSMTKAKRAH